MGKKILEKSKIAGSNLSHVDSLWDSRVTPSNIDGQGERKFALEKFSQTLKPFSDVTRRF